MGHLVEVIKDYNGQNVKTVYGYDHLWRLNAVTEPHASGEIDANYTTKYSYNALGKVTAVTYPDGTKVLLNYDPATNKVTIIDESDKTVLIEEYNWADQLVKATVKNVTLEGAPANQVWTFSYDSLGRKLAEKHPLEGVTNYVYDYLGRLTQKGLPAADVLLPGQESITTGFVPTQSYGYDDRGNKVWECGPTVTCYRASVGSGEKTQQETRYAYDKLGNKTHEWYDYQAATYDAAKRKTQSVYNSLGLLTETIDAKGNRTKYVYDAAGNIRRVTDASGNVTVYNYNNLGWLTSETYIGKAASYTYDAGGRRASATDRKAQTTTYEYYLNNLLQRVNYADGLAVEYQYDPAVIANRSRRLTRILIQTAVRR